MKNPDWLSTEKRPYFAHPPWVTAAIGYGELGRGKTQGEATDKAWEHIRERLQEANLGPVLIVSPNVSAMISAGGDVVLTRPDEFYLGMGGSSYKDFDAAITSAIGSILVENPAIIPETWESRVQIRAFSTAARDRTVGLFKSALKIGDQT